MTAPVLLVLIVNRLVDFSAQMYRLRYPTRSLLWCIPAAMVLAGVLAYACKVQLFPDVAPALGRMLTGVAIGGAAGVLSELLKIAKEFAGWLRAVVALEQEGG